jgi:hypothetical protein
MLVTKKLVSAACARAGSAARIVSEAAPRPKHAREMILGRVGIDSSDLFLMRRLVAPACSDLG